MRHKHAELMMEYAKDAMETDKPWERWEILNDEFMWVDLCQDPEWKFLHKYRRKQKTININGHEVPEPVRTPLENGTIYYIPNVYNNDIHNSYEWRGDLADLALLKMGVVHLTKEDCVKHTKALLSFTSENL